MTDLNLMDKTLGCELMYGEDSQSIDRILIVCKDALAFFVHNLTSLCTLNKLIPRSASHPFRLRELIPSSLDFFITKSLLLLLILFLQYYILVREG